MTDPDGYSLQYESDVLAAGAESVCDDADTVRPTKKTKREEKGVAEEPSQAPVVAVKKEGSDPHDQYLSDKENGLFDSKSECQTLPPLDEAKKHIAVDDGAPVIKEVPAFSQDAFELAQADPDEDKASRYEVTSVKHEEEDVENIPPPYDSPTSAASRSAGSGQCKDVRKTHYGRKPRVLKSRLLAGAML